MDATREWLDAQYDARALVDDADAIIADWGARSDALRRDHPPLVISYGDDPRQAVDVYSPPPGGGTAPLVVFVHGGYWQALDKEHFGFLAEPFLTAGAVFASLDYRLVPDVAIADVIADVRAGIAELARRAGDFGVHPTGIGLVGHSAGGHLVAEAMTTDWAAHDLPADTIGPVVGISGLYDLEPIRRSYLNDVLAMSEQDAHDASPVHHTPTGPGPLLLTCGGGEPEEFDRQQRLLVDAWPGVPITTLEQEGGTHFDACTRLAMPGPLRDEAVPLLVRG
ncbi:alpha/beta hydrolase [Actinomycetospora termitidis]|uniref:Alpha/beta hydrolase n=1 Tax=Actinomycetospora termitidis TaxID=3053470 RepID=A0ABT7MFP4_9PSEU|nr:alpha/beta hydrolase [Actinomycetospora sp. Odt1-22]MDL5159266.1 alpha/beta hydrolase [Actinomycetospora sp. Odt1-22]